MRKHWGVEHKYDVEVNEVAEAMGNIPLTEEEQNQLLWLKENQWSVNRLISFPHFNRKRSVVDDRKVILSALFWKKHYGNNFVPPKDEEFEKLCQSYNSKLRK